MSNNTTLCLFIIKVNYISAEGVDALQIIGNFKLHMIHYHYGTVNKINILPYQNLIISLIKISIENRYLVLLTIACIDFNDHLPL